MQIGLVVGTVTASVKHSSLKRAKLLLVQPLMADGSSPDGEPVVTIDVMGAGAGERVLLNTDGAELQQMLSDERTPARFSVMGICDR